MNGFKLVIQDKGLTFLRENGKIIIQFIFTMFFIALGIWFFHHERTELEEVKQTLISSSLLWVVLGITITVIYITLHGFMYQAAFRSIGAKLQLSRGIELFLKRNLISVFLPAGGVSSLAFFSGDIERKGITKTQIHLASSFYGFIGILSVIMVAIPAFIYGLTTSRVGKGEWLALGATILLIFGLIYLYRSLINKRAVFRFIHKYFPNFEAYIDDLRSKKINIRWFLLSLFYSLLIEVSGIVHLYIAMKALHMETSWFACTLGYIIAVVFLVISPFLRGLGAVEFSLTYVLVSFGYSTVEAVSITLLYRLFEFWLPLFGGVLAFVLKINKFLTRIVPALFLLALGIVNITSVITPDIRERVEFIKGFLSSDIIAASHYFVLASGLFLLVTAAFMLKGLRTAWYFALLFSIVSFVGNITKGIDYEEASLALVVILILVYTRKQYYIKTNPRLRTVGLQTALWSIAAVLIYGTLGFYFLDKRHFEIDFNVWQSIRYTFQNYFLVGSNDLVPMDKFARNFLYSINISGFLSISFVIYAFIRPYIYKGNSSEEDFERARNLLARCGNSSLDFFKISPDKMLFFPESCNCFIAYRVAGNYAVVLENPVTPDNGELKECIRQFDKYCFENGMKSLYYRVPESSLPVYGSLRKKNLFLGQEAIVDLTTFTLEGGSKKSMRNAVNKVRERGYKSHVHQPPIKDGLLQKLKAVSDEWLHDTQRSEIIFSQGMFDWAQLKQQTIITVESPEEKIVAFLNIIPDYTPDSGTYDLIRKTVDAPNGIMDFIIIEAFNYFKSQNIRYVNMGFAPLSGIEKANTLPERSLKFAYEKIKAFGPYKGLREYKEKFTPVWYNKYLIYDHDYDLLQVPGVLNKVIKP